MGLMYTYKKPLGNWKGKTVTNNVPVWSNNNPSKTVDYTAFKARPLKIWRKQLHTRTNGKSGVGIPTDIPGGLVTTNNGSNCKPNHLVTHITPNYKGCPIIKDASGNLVKKQCNVTKTASTIIDKNYHSDSKSYLQNKCNSNIVQNTNTKFKTNSAVESSTRVLRLKVDTQDYFYYN
tara:strand:+ start:6027 stop:6557 length:531 start_codon:yes stop_codon:yes gene_type:complete